jgi:hypothetical protein
MDCVDIDTVGFFRSDVCGASCSTIQQRVIDINEDYQVFLLSVLVYVEKFKRRMIKGERAKMAGNMGRGGSVHIT